MSTSELTDAVDDEGKNLGIRDSVKGLIRRGLRYPIAEIWLFDDAGDVLIQRRSRLLSYGMHWDATAAGHVMAGEQPADTAVRELQEETGVALDPEALILAGVYNVESSGPETPRAKQREHIYVARCAELPDHLKLQASEVGAVRVVSLDQLEAEIGRDTEHREFVPRTKAYAAALSAMRRMLAS